VVCPYPYLAPWLRRVPDRNVVYYNLDDYALYDPTRAVKTAQLEKEIVQRARISFCLSLHQVEALRSKYPDAARRIVHFPLGVDEKFLNPKPDLSPLPKTVGYVGNLTNRVDWKLVGNVADALPDIAFKFIGSLNKINDGNDDSSWKADRQASLGRKNVEFLGEVPQNKVMEHYWQYSVNWMPYDTRHPFNIASCPTKIMDALASGRPFVSTKIPEVLSLSDRVYVATDARHAANLIRSAIEGEINHNTADQLVFAKRQTWEIRAKEMLVHLDSNAYET
jgi:glycosyltransferase involved in cell wall biosynthesis